MRNSDSYLVSFRIEAGRYAQEKIDEQDLIEAAHARGLQVMSYFLEAGGEYSRDTIADTHPATKAQAVRYGVGLSIGAISLYSRAELWDHARYLGSYAETMIDRINEIDERQAVIGLCDEWRGDIHTILDPEEAEQYYRRAGDAYEPLDEHPEYSGWGSEPEFTAGFNGYVEHITALGYEEAYDSAPKPLQVRFLERIDFKRIIIAELTEE